MASNPQSVDCGETNSEKLAAMLSCYSILDHRLATRGRYTGADLLKFIETAHREASMALNGLPIDDILEARQ